MCRYRQPDMFAALIRDTAEVPDPPADRLPDADDTATTDVEELVGS